MTYKEALIEAYKVQDACNLSGVVKSWARCLDTVWEKHRETGTSAVNSDPVCILFASKVAQLTNCEDAPTLAEAVLKGKVAACYAA